MNYRPGSGGNLRLSCYMEGEDLSVMVLEQTNKFHYRKSSSGLAKHLALPRGEMDKIITARICLKIDLSYEEGLTGLTKALWIAYV